MFGEFATSLCFHCREITLSFYSGEYSQSSKDQDSQKYIFGQHVKEGVSHQNQFILEGLCSCKMLWPFLARNFGHLSSSFMSWPRSTVELQCMLLDDEFSKTKLSIQFHCRKPKMAHFPLLILATALIFCCSGVFSNVMIRVWLVSILIINLSR